MTKLTLGAAARSAGVSKTTLRRMVEAGRLSAERGEDGAFRIDASELGRFMDSRPPDPPRTESEEKQPPAHAPLPSTLEDLRARLKAESKARLIEERLRMMEAQLAASERSAEEWKEEARSWRAQAERLLIASEAAKTPERPSGLWRRIFGGKGD